VSRYSIIAVIFLLLYSTIILYIEYSTSQKFVRYFLTDIEGPVPFYAINTTLSYTLFIISSVLFLISTYLVKLNKEIENRSEIYFYISQVLIFLYLGMDDRFYFHERLYHHIGIPGDGIIILIGIIELIILFTIGRITERNSSIKNSFYLMCLFAFFMILIDLIVPENMLLRLSLEDLSKTWSAFFVVRFAWLILSENINKISEYRKN